MGAVRNSDCDGNVHAIARREALRKLGRVGAAVLACVLICVGLYDGYKLWRNAHLEKQATEFAARGDVQSAVLTARQLLAIQNDNPTAVRLMAELAERCGSPEAIEWRKKLAALRPQDAETQLAFARTALRFGQLDLAGRLLDALPQPAHGANGFEELAGAVALARGDAPEAERHFQSALAQDPQNDCVALDFSIVRLTSKDPANIAAARADLRRLSDRPAVRAGALRALAADAAAHHDFAAAEQATAALTAAKDAPFSDYLLYLEATNAVADAMARCKTAALKSAENSAQLMAWLNRHDRSSEALALADSLPKNLRETQPLPLAIAESLSCARDWQRLAQFAHSEKWGRQEALRLAIESHATRHVSNDAESSTEAATLWRAAIKAAHRQTEQLFAIARLAQGWGYRAEAQEVLWSIANGSTGAKDALAALQNSYKQTLDTRGLLRVAKRAFELNPNDLIAANNCASLGLLLNSDPASRHLAEKLHAEHPANAAFAVTYAFALHSEGKTADALRVIESLKETQLRQPALAAYYVVMLAESGKLDRAREFLPAAEHAALLPEERDLLTNAARKVAVVSTAGS